MQPDDDFLTGGVLIRRCFAWAIDMILIGVLVFGIAILIWMAGLATLGLGFAMFAILPFVPFLYHVLTLLSPTSATPGQHLCGLMVRRNRDLGQPGLLQVVVCVLLYYATLATSGLLLVVALFTTRRRTLHDLASGLVVIRTESFEALTPAPGYWNMANGSYPRQ